MTLRKLSIISIDIILLSVEKCTLINLIKIGQVRINWKFYLKNNYFKLIFSRKGWFLLILTYFGLFQKYMSKDALLYTTNVFWLACFGVYNWIILWFVSILRKQYSLMIYFCLGLVILWVSLTYCCTFECIHFMG